jgi:L-iditol 2-dehydrogenase
MIQQVMLAPRLIEFREADKPKPAPGEVLLRIRRIGVCGSDIHVYHGRHPFTKYPVTQGHEVSGEVVELGAGAAGAAGSADLHVGQKVTIQPQVVCGKCYPCAHGKYNLCEELKVMGFQATGAASEYFAVDAAKATPLPDSMSFDEGAMIEPLAVAVHAVRQSGGIGGLNAVVLGAGPIGNLVAQAAKGMGAAKVMITDISGWRLRKAAECGVGACVNTNGADLGDAIAERFGPDKADIIYDCAGTNASMGQAIKHARKGSAIILVAVFSDMATIDLAVANDHELCINSTMMYRGEDYLDAMRLVAEGKVSLAPLVSKHFPFLEYGKAYEHIDANRETTMKVIIDVDDAG